MRCRVALTRPSEGPLQRLHNHTQSAARQRGLAEKELRRRAGRRRRPAARGGRAQLAARPQAGAGRGARTSGRSTTRAQNSARMAAAGSTNDSGTWASASRMLTRGVRTWLRARRERGLRRPPPRGGGRRGAGRASVCKPPGSAPRALWRPPAARRQAAQGHARLQPALRAGRGGAHEPAACGAAPATSKLPASHAEPAQGMCDVQVLLADQPEQNAPQHGTLRFVPTASTSAPRGRDRGEATWTPAPGARLRMSEENVSVAGRPWPCTMAASA